MSRIIVFGATSRIAQECARLWVAQGHSLYLVGRNVEKLNVIEADLKTRAGKQQAIMSAVSDLNDLTGHEALFSQAESALDGLDVVMVAHGTLPDQKACEASVPLTMDAMQSNALSVISLLGIAANRLEQKRHGIIVVIGSVAGDRGRQSNYVYGAAKGMVDIFAEGLRNRLSKANVAVVTIKPGFVDTPMTAHIQRKGPLWAPPTRVAQGIVQAVMDRDNVVYLPRFWRVIMLVIRSIPETIFKRLSL